MKVLQASPVTAKQIKTWTSHDPVLSKVRDKVLQGWVDTSDPSMQLYQHRKCELSIEDECILWGNRIIVPPPGQDWLMLGLTEEICDCSYKQEVQAPSEEILCQQVSPSSLSSHQILW